VLTCNSAQYDVSQLNSRINAVQKQIGLKKKAKEDASDLLKEKLGLEAQKKSREVDAIGLHNELQVLLKTVGNYVAESVPVSQTEDDNEVDRTWAPEGFDKARAMLSHHEVLSRLDGYDPVRGVKLAGHRGYCLTNYGVLLNQALINYGLDFLHGKGSTLVQPPYFLNKQMMAKVSTSEIANAVDADTSNRLRNFHNSTRYAELDYYVFSSVLVLIWCRSCTTSRKARKAKRTAT
jgi:seryl-tRNA synthetase